MNGVPAATMTETDTHKIVRESYAKRVTDTDDDLKGCCKKKAPACCSKMMPSADIQRAAEKMGYTNQDVADAPEESNLGLGCGAPLRLAQVQPGETVLDLGSGAGFDAFLASRMVGAKGQVIGVDMTPEMVEKAKSNATKNAYTNVDFRLGYIEALPVDSNSVDLIISNCVLNLSPDKPAVFREAYRVLKDSGGARLAVSDICLTHPLPEKVRTNLAAYVGCIAGASLLDDYVGMMRDAGFKNIKVQTKQAFEVLACDDPIVKAMMDGIEQENELERVKTSVVSASVVAYK